MHFNIKKASIFFSVLFMMSCSSPESTEKETTKEKTITGITLSIENGKDGYTAQIETETKETYAALVSISNLGGMDNFKRLNVGDTATLTGELWNEKDPSQMKVTAIVSIKTAAHDLIIEDGSFEGISLGDQISSHTNILEKDKLENGEGSFDVFAIKNEKHGKIGYLLKDPNDESLVGNIIIQSAMAKTKTGLHVGSTLADLITAKPNLKVHGSEIEGRTHAVIGNLSFRLNVDNYSYEVDISTIPKTSTVMEIQINR